MMYDFAIIGGGPTGYSAAMYAGRLGLKTIIFAPAPGGLIVTTEWGENYPGFKRINGVELFQRIQEHAREYPIVENTSEVIAITWEVADNSASFVIQTKKERLTARTILFATGSKYRKLILAGSEKFENRGIHYCALCDGFAYKNKIVAIVGGGNSAAREAIELAEHAEHVYILVRGMQLKVEPINLQRVAQNQKVTVLTNTTLQRIIGDEKITGIEVLTNGSDQQQLSVVGIFVAIGHEPASDLAVKLNVSVDEHQQIITNRYTETNIPGVYAAGDVTNTHFKQLITGCADGVIAAWHAFNFVHLNI